MTTSNASPWSFEAPVERGRFLVRAALSGVLAVLSLAAAGGAVAHLSAAGVLLAAGATLVCGQAALIAWRAAHDIPLRLDERGLRFRDARGEVWLLGWHEVEDVGIARSRLTRRVSLRVRREGWSEPEMVSLSRRAMGDAPVEWVAGTIETFRHRALHPD